MNTATSFRRASRVAGLKIAEIVQISEPAAALKRAGRDVVSLATGEPDLPAPPEVIEAAHQVALAGQRRYPPTLSTPALTGDRAGIDMRRAALLARRNRVVAALNAIMGIECPSPEGAFYVFPKVTRAMRARGFKTDAEFCDWLLESALVAIVPGRAFGLHGHAKLCFAYSDHELDTGLTRIAAALGERN